MTLSSGNGLSMSRPLSNPKESHAAGTAYTLTNTPAALDFGTTDPSITLSEPGTYLIIARARVRLNAATFAANRTTTLKLRRTNNTAADVTNGSTAIDTGIVTTLTAALQNPVWFATYTTTRNDDIITIFGDVSVVPTAGALDVSEASLVAIKLSV